MPVTLKRAGGATRLPSPDFHPRAHSYTLSSELYIYTHTYIYIYATRIEGEQGRNKKKNKRMENRVEKKIHDEHWYS